jgi:type IV pilus assembly protein PilE
MQAQLRCRRGVTIVELLIVLVISAILGAMLYPSYQQFQVRSRRSEGMAALLSAMQLQERYYEQHSSYLAFSSSSLESEEHGFRWWSGDSAAASAYELQAEACDGQAITQCVEIKAVPGTNKVDSRFRDEQCATLSLASTGEHGASGPFERCWP